MTVALCYGIYTPTYSIKGRRLIWLSHESPEDSCLEMCSSHPHTCPLCCLCLQHFPPYSLPRLSLPASGQTLSGAAALLSVASGLSSQGPLSRQLLTCHVFQTPVLTSLSLSSYSCFWLFCHLPVPVSI